MRPLYNWNVPRGYKFGDSTFYNEFHIGTDYIVPIGTPVVAPFDGIARSSLGVQGGNTVTLVGTNTARCLHLSKFGKSGAVKMGDVIGWSGNTGLSTNPHLHLDIKVNGSYIDPEQYFMPAIIPITVIGYAIPGLKEEVEKWSKGFFTVDINWIPRTLAYNPNFDYTPLLQGRYCIIACDPAPEIYKTSLTNDLNTAYAIAGRDALTTAYEVSHMIHKYYLAHRGNNPYIDIEDTIGGVTDEQRYRKFEVMKPYVGIILGNSTAQVMTEEEVVGVYVLAFYREPDAGEKAYWTGKRLKDFLATAIKDRAEFLQNHE